MSNVDILILILLSLGGWLGYKWGLIFMVFTLISLLAGVWLIFHYNREINEGINTLKLEGYFYALVCIIIICLALFVGKIASWFSEKVLKIIFMNWVNKGIGLTIGIIAVWMFLSFAIIYSNSFISIQSHGKNFTNKSTLIKYLLITGNILPGKENMDSLKETIQEQLKSPEEISLP